MNPIYLDNHATTPVDPRVLEDMLPYFTERFGNASSKQHSYGWAADEAVEKARRQVADLIGATPAEIYFTGSASESDNQALVGIFENYSEGGAHFISTPIEHKAILETLKYLETRGAAVTIVPVDKLGRVDPTQIEKSIRSNTRVISVIFASNEIGTINPIADIGAIAKKHGVLFHTDAVQAIGRTPIDVVAMGIDMLSIAGHKIFGPKGIGALYVKKTQPRIKLAPLIRGGGQEKGFRSGTLNVPGIVGLGRACELMGLEFESENKRISRFRNLMIREFQSIPNAHINGDLENRLPHNVSITLKDIRAHQLIAALKELAISTGSACSTQSVEPSYVLKAIGLSEEDSVSTIRFGLGRFTSENDVRYAIEVFKNAVSALRQKGV
jgi:cysteine desulfurase